MLAMDEEKERMLSKNAPYFVREADLDADREAILGIWEKKESGVALTAEKLDWMYKSNPAGQGRIFLLCREGVADPVGTVGVAPRKFVSERGVFVAGLIIDFVVLSGHRTLGPGLLLQRAAIDAVKSDLDFTLSFPNRMSRILRERLGFDERRTLHEFVCPIGLEAYISQRIPKILRTAVASLHRVYLHTCWRVQAGKRMVRRDYSPEFMRELWESVSRSSAAIGLRDPEVLEWRLQDRPNGHVGFFCIESADKNDSGYIAYTVSPDQKVNVIDSLAKSDSFSQRMYASFLQRMARDGIVSVALRAELVGVFVLRPQLLGLQRRGDKPVYLAMTREHTDKSFVSKIAVSGYDGDS
jgi:hypothetical protein